MKLAVPIRVAVSALSRSGGVQSSELILVKTRQEWFPKSGPDEDGGAALAEFQSSELFKSILVKTRQADQESPQRAAPSERR